MGDPLLAAFRDIVHLGLHLWDLSGTPACPQSADCVCAACEPIIQERVPEALTTALAFAQSQWFVVHSYSGLCIMWVGST